MSRKKTNDSVNFSCKMDADIAKRLEKFCEATRLKKTAVVELALEEYLKVHTEEDE